jgi:tRNA (guanine-N7-)-methyltransferase
MPADPNSPGEPSPYRYLTLAPRPPEGPIELMELWPERDGEIELEIGFGRGMFLLERACSAPHARLLGIEIKSKWAYLVAQRAAGLPRVRVFAADAREFLPRLTPAHSLARVFMHFPDPWWKKRHAKRRLGGQETLDPLARLLRPGGELFIQTDVEERAQGFVRDLRAHDAFEVANPPYVADHEFGARSNREKRAIADGLPVYRILARRK